VSIEIKVVGVVGCGTMGSGICEVCARAGFDVVFMEQTDELVAAGHDRIRRSVERAVGRGKMSEQEGAGVLDRITSTTTIAGLADCDLVFEAVPEKLELKKKVFAELDAVVKEDAIFATNTSSLPVIDMAVATRRPSRVVGFHFFNPAQVMKLVELVHTVATEEPVLAGARAFAERLGKVPVPCRDRAGFIANLLLFPYLNSSVRMFEAGYASREDIDAAMQFGCGHPMGPLALLDLIGLDSGYEICEALYRQWRESSDAPAPLLKQYVVAGYLGRKTGRGFYRYEAPESSKVVDAAPDSDDDDAAGGVATVGIVGTGLMASGIAEVAAKGGHDVVLRGRSEASIKRAKAAVKKSVDRAVDKGKMAEDDAAAALDRVTTTLEFSDLAECDIVIEGVAEDLDVKLGVFRELDAAVKPDAVLATTTSSLSVIDLAGATGRPDRVLGLHFFNPYGCDRARRRAARRGVGARPREAPGEVPRPRRVHRQLLALSVPQRRRPHARGGLQHAGRHRFRDEARLRPSDGAVRAHGHRRARRHACDPRLAPRGVPGAEIRAGAAARAHGARRLPRPQDRPGLLHVHLTRRAGLSVPVLSLSESQGTQSAPLAVALALAVDF
jgi:3-hydroxybutyryl-CoA dehydrogenase